MKPAKPAPKTASVKIQPPPVKPMVAAIPPAPPKPETEAPYKPIPHPPLVSTPRLPKDIIAPVEALVADLEDQRKANAGAFAGEYDKIKGYQGASNQLAIGTADRLEGLVVRLRAIVVR